ncbi:hypothetical protein HBE96_10340 [Clostridium sp. P21]|uniref:Uncharacterized protein n=2 Tax=Clostridium muellerianum TaxID=2716538 RepID=A0A7Y0HNF0_9CLOT|nr:hypothetical protein [Clostridium muellerianum]
MLQTLKCLGVVENQKKGEYKASLIDIKNEKAVTLILLAIIATNSKAYYEIAELSQVPYMFPFSYSVSHELLYSSDLFVLNNFGGKVVVTGE